MTSPTTRRKAPEKRWAYCFSASRKNYRVIAEGNGGEILAECTELEIAKAIVRAHNDLLPASVGGDGWRPIETAPRDKTCFLAATADGRIMIWAGFILFRDQGPMNGKMPDHLQFPATHWMPLPTPPGEKS